MALQRHHSQWVQNSDFSHKKNMVAQAQGIQYPKAYQYCIIISKVTAIFLKGLFLPIGGVALQTVSAQPAKQACLFNMPRFVY